MESIVINGDRPYEPCLYVQFFSHERDPFLKRLVIGLGFYIKMCIANALDLKTIDLQLSRNLDFTRKKFFCLFDRTAKIYYEFLPQDESINYAKYRNQLDKLKVKIDGWGHNDNAKPHVALTVKEKLLQIGTFYCISILPRSCSIRLLLILLPIIKKLNFMKNDSNSQAK